MIQFIGDLNRKYPTKLNTKSSCVINNKIINLIKYADFHEGLDFIN